MVEDKGLLMATGRTDASDVCFSIGFARKIYFTLNINYRDPIVSFSNMSFIQNGDFLDALFSLSRNKYILTLKV